LIIEDWSLVNEKGTKAGRCCCIGLTNLQFAIFSIVVRWLYSLVT
jgi:hypothetical protein